MRKEKKVIFNMYICDHSYDNQMWIDNVAILKSIKFPTSIPTSNGHHRGLTIQVLLDMNIEETGHYANSLLTMFKSNPTIVISEVEVNMKNSPIGHYFDQDLWEPGVYFDKLISQRKSGLYRYYQPKNKTL